MNICACLCIVLPHIYIINAYQVVYYFKLFKRNCLGHVFLYYGSRLFIHRHKYSNKNVEYKKKII